MSHFDPYQMSHVHTFILLMNARNIILSSKIKIKIIEDSSQNIILHRLHR